MSSRASQYPSRLNSDRGSAYPAENRRHSANSISAPPVQRQRLWGSWAILWGSPLNGAWAGLHIQRNLSINMPLDFSPMPPHSTQAEKQVSMTEMWFVFLYGLPTATMAARSAAWGMMPIRRQNKGGAWPLSQTHIKNACQNIAFGSCRLLPSHCRT